MSHRKVAKSREWSKTQIVAARLDRGGGVITRLKDAWMGGRSAWGWVFIVAEYG